MLLWSLSVSDQLPPPRSQTGGPVCGAEAEQVPSEPAAPDSASLLAGFSDVAGTPAAPFFTPGSP